jgi:hypothetical protein
MELYEEKTLIFKKYSHPNDESYEARLNRAKNEASFKISATRAKNVMIRFKYQRNDNPPEMLTVFLTAKKGSYSNIINLALNKTEYEDEFAIVLYTYLGSDISGDFIVEEIYFLADEIENDFELAISVHKKWTYQLHAGKYSDEFWFDDGELHHSAGDLFSYNESTMINVMEIDGENYIAHCSYIGLTQ